MRYNCYETDCTMFDVVEPGPFGGGVADTANDVLPFITLQPKPVTPDEELLSPPKPFVLPMPEATTTTTAVNDPASGNTTAPPTDGPQAGAKPNWLLLLAIAAGVYMLTKK